MIQILFVLFIIIFLLSGAVLWLSKYLPIEEETQSILVCPLQYARRMFLSSFLLLINVLDGYYEGIYDCSLIIFICWINSLNYWRLPTHGIRRNIDVITAIFATYYHYNCSYELSIDHGDIYRTGMMTFIGWYGMALYFGRIKNNKHYASICHVNIHCTAIIFNLWLFSQLYMYRNGVI